MSTHEQGGPSDIAGKPASECGGQALESATDREAGQCEALRQKICLLEAEAARTRTELDKLRYNESRYRELVQESCSVILRMDAQGNVTFANRHALSFFGFTEKELLGKNVVGTIVPFVERSGRNLAELIQDICEHPERYQDNENENTQQDGTSKWMAWTNKGIRDASGRPQEILCIGNDITARKQAEEALQREQQSLRGVLESQQHELKLVAYEIHDGLAQLLSGASMQFQAFDSMQPGTEAARKAYQTGRDLLDRALMETRRLIADLRPPMLENAGAVGAIQQLIDRREKQNRPKVEFVCDESLPRLDSLVENALFRIAQEGLNNATRHSGSDRVRIALRQQKDRVLLEIKDWGQGFDTSTVRADRFGLKGLRERARILGGKACIESALGQGTLITVQFPLTVSGQKRHVDVQSGWRQAGAAGLQ